MNVAYCSIPAKGPSGSEQPQASTMKHGRYLELLENRIVELLIELDDDEGRRAMMHELGDAAWESGVYAPPPNPENSDQWAVNLLSGNPAMTSVIQNKLAFEWMSDPGNIESLDEIVSAFRPSQWD